MRVRVLGPVEVIGDAGPVPGLERRGRELLAILALRAPHPVAIDELIDLVWDEPPPSARKTVQAHLSRLRAVLVRTGDPLVGLERVGQAYRLQAGPGGTDVDVVATRRAEARRAREGGDHRHAVAALASARRHWRGDIELPATIPAAALAARCAHERQQLATEHLAAIVDGDAPADAVGELQARTTADPVAEGDWALLVRALGRSGQRSAALRAYQAARAGLAEVGLEPGTSLRAAEAEVLGAPEAADRAVGPRPRPRPAPAVRYTPVASHQVASVVIGEQPPAVLLVNPGVISIDGLHEEPHVAAAVDALAGLGGLVSFDRRGIGLSDRDALLATTASRGGRGPGGPPPPGDADNPHGADVVIAAWADDAAAVLHAAGAGPVLVVGNSDSCLVALMLAARHPEAVAGLVLVHPYARYTRAPTYPHGLDPSTAAAMSGDVLTLDERPARFDPLSHIAPSLAADHGFRAWWDALGRRAAGPRAAAALHRAIFESDVRQVVPEVAAPTLLVHRRSCAGYDVGHLRWLAERLPHARVAGLAGADELWFVGDVAALVEAVERFAAQVSLGSR